MTNYFGSLTFTPRTFSGTWNVKEMSKIYKVLFPFQNLESIVLFRGPTEKRSHKLTLYLCSLSRECVIVIVTGETRVRPEKTGGSYLLRRNPNFRVYRWIHVIVLYIIYSL